MNWQEKLKALKRLDKVEASINAYKPVVLGFDDVHVGGDGFLRSIHGGGDTLEEAVEELWNEVTHMPAGLYLVVRQHRDNASYQSRRIWDGEDWRDPRTNMLESLLRQYDANV